MHVDDYIKMEMQGQGSSSSSMPPPSIPPPPSEPRRLEVCIVVSVINQSINESVCLFQVKKPI